MPSYTLLHAWLQKLLDKAHAQQVECYIVGGFLRDLWFGQQSVDIDITGSPGFLKLIESLVKQEESRAQFVWRHHLIRVQIGDVRLDCSELHGDTIEADLRLRDFTINALALPLPDFLAGVAASNVIDLFGGRADIQQKLLVALPGSLTADPLRIFRGARLLQRYQLTATPATVAEAKKAGLAIDIVPKERIAAEIFSVLEHETTGYLQALTLLGGDIALWGRTPNSTNDFVSKQLESVIQKSYWPTSLGEKITQELHANLTIIRRRVQILRLAALLYDFDGVSKGPQANTVQSTLTILLAASERETLRKTLAATRQVRLAVPQTKISIYHYFREYGTDGVLGLLLWLAGEGPQSKDAVEELIRLYVTKNRLVCPPQYVDGRTIATAVKAKKLPYILIKNIQASLLQAAALSEINNVAEAEAFLAGLLDSL